MSFDSIIASLNANGPMLCFVGAAVLLALANFAEFIGKTLARFYTSRFVRGKL